MTVNVNKQDSNSTNLSYAVEDSAATLPVTPTWYQLEPNSYKDYGADVKTKARMPINSSRQLKKGVVVDIDGSAGFQQDLTPENFQAFAECFLCAVARDKDDTAVPVVDGTGNAYQPTSGGTVFQASDLILAKDATSAADDLNLGLKVVTGTPTATNVAVTDTGLVDGTGQVITISRVGFQFSSGVASIDANGGTGGLPRLVLTNVAATSTLTGDGTEAADTSTVTINGIVYTFQTTLTAGSAGAVHVHRAGSAAGTLTNLFRAINNSGGTPGTDYSTTGTGANTYVTATNPTGTTVVITAILAGTIGNTYTTTTAGTSHVSWTGAVMASGAGRGGNTFGLIPGEFVYIGDDSATHTFATAVDAGFCRVRAVGAGYIDFDKTQFTMTDDNGSGKTLRIYFGRVIKNESDATLIIKRSLQLERSMSFTDTAQVTQIQAEYMLNCLANEVKVDMKTADIIRMEYGFLANTNELVESTTGLKSGNRPTLLDADAFNTTSDVSFTKLAIVTTGDAAPRALFSYFTDLTMDIKNNVKQNKAIGVLGAFDSTFGFFQCKGSLTAYFTDVAEMQSVKDNDSITLETHLVKFNKGISFDFPLLTMSKAMADVKINEPIMIPLEGDAATAKIIDTTLDHTLLCVFWDYLPTVAG